MIRRMKSWEFTKEPRFDEKSHPYVYKNVCDLTDKEMWKSLVSIGKDQGPFASLAKWLAPNFKLTYTDLNEFKVHTTQRCIDHAHYDELKSIVRKMLTLAKHSEVW